ncbi:MAG: hypothetical protein LLG37_06120 [Spirochaetia bacterium]|nr:hypothetical protein [Spirochaetia bacterium]
MTFLSGVTVPPAAKTNGGTQTITNMAKLYLSGQNMMPPAVNAGQADVDALRIGFRNSSSTTDMTVTGLNLTVFNYEGTVNANRTLTRIVISDGAVTYASATTMPASSSIAIPFSTNLTVPYGGAVKNVDVFISVTPAINTYDVGISLSHAADVTTLAGNTVDAYGGYYFPSTSNRAIITSPVSSVNVSAVSLMPVSVTAGQAGIKTMLFTFTHPLSVTTYADCVIKGVTLTCSSTPSKGMSFLFSKLEAGDGVSVYGSAVSFQNQSTVWIPFTNPLTITAGTYKSVTLTADILSSVTVTGFNLTVDAAGNIAAIDGSDSHDLTVSGAFPMAGNQAVVQAVPTGLNAAHVNKMPATAVRGQQFVYAQDIIFTHTDAAGTAAISVRGLTLTVENELGGGIVPSSVLSKITILDGSNNTVVSYSAIPSSGTKVYIDFTEPVTVTPSASAVLKVYAHMPVDGTLQAG